MTYYVFGDFRIEEGSKKNSNRKDIGNFRSKYVIQ